MEIIPQTQFTSAQTSVFQTQTKFLKQYFKEHPKQIIGSRIIYSNQFATVKYFGPLLHHIQETQNSQLWVGVQWDDDKRGKHNGIVQGIKYFQCQQNRGSLIKFEKIEFGYKLETALFKRYFRMQQFQHAKSIYEQLEQIKKSNRSETEKQIARDALGPKQKKKSTYDAQSYVETLKKNKVMVEFIGFDEIWRKLHDLDRIQNISLSQSKICDLGQEGKLKNLLPNIKNLSLQSSLLYDWNQIYYLGHELQNLSQLSLSYNRLRQPQELSDRIRINYSNKFIERSLIGLFKNLKSLVLIQTDCNWKNIFRIQRAFPNIQQLILCKNNMCDFQNINFIHQNTLQNLKFLNLQQTNLQDFQGIKKFKNLNSLQKLTINKNKIKNFGHLQGFIKLKSLSIQSNLILDPYVISQISKLTNIQYINLKHNPVSQMKGMNYVRQRIIAQFPKLKFINGADLKKYQKKDCQIFYLRQTFSQYFFIKKVPDYDYDFQDFTNWSSKIHPNVFGLIKKYGNPYQPQKKQIVQLIKQQQRALNNKRPTGVIDFKVQFRKGMHQGKIHDYKRIPISWTIANLKNFFAKTIKVSVKKQKLSYKCQETEGLLNEEMKTLGYYNINKESIIYFDIYE